MKIKVTKVIRLFTTRAFVTLVLFAAPVMMLWAQEMNKKFSMTTEIFLNEQNEKKGQSEGEKGSTTEHYLSDGTVIKPRKLVADPITIDGVSYISCFIHLQDAGKLKEIESLGVKVEETFDGQDFITALVPVKELNRLADIDNVTLIKVAQLMHPSTDVSRQKTNVNDLLTLSSSAENQGINTMYDGTGVVLGIIDTGIDFQHIAFKDKAGNSRIKRAYVYNGSAQEYSSITTEAPTTDDNTQDHGTHTASTAGGSSVIVSGSTVTVTDEHANATYGGMAPGADLYLAGIKNLPDTYLTNALKKIVAYADAQKKPLVVSNSWGSGWGPRDGTGEWATLVGTYFGDNHPNHIILFASSNDAGNCDEGHGGYFIKKSSASSDPLGTIIRTRGNKGNYYVGLMACAWSTRPLNCNLYVLDNSTGEILKSWTVTENNTSTFEGLDTYYSGSIKVYIEQVTNTNKYRLAVYSSKGINSTNKEGNGAYTLAIEVYPSSESANIDMWGGDFTFFSNILTTTYHTWTAGTDDMCVSDEATIPDAISVGAYVSRTEVPSYNGNTYYWNSSGSLDDIAYFSSYATAEKSPTGLAYPWITAPGAQLVAGVNHYHTMNVNDDSYFNPDYPHYLSVNNSDNPYGVMQGTSMATPVAAGIVALWLQAAQSVGKTLTVNQVKDIMARTAINDAFTTTGTNASHFGNGKIDALAGIGYILSNFGYLDLANSSNNSEAISNAIASNKVYDVTLSDRTLYKDGDWNTLCLPFNVSDSDADNTNISTGGTDEKTFSGTPLEGATVMELDVNGSYEHQTGLADDGTLYLNFKPAYDIVAGTPYIIKWTDGDNLVNPTFNNVTITSTAPTAVNSTDGNVTFKGTYAYTQYTNQNNNILLLGANNKLYYPQPAHSDPNDETSAMVYPNIGAFRAYFALNNGITAGNSSNPQQGAVRAFKLNFGDEGEKTGITTTNDTNFTNSSDAWYDLSGRRLSGKPSAKGLYIKNGKKVVVK